MNDPVAFLYDKAEETRALAAATPEIGGELRRMAEFIEEQTDELRRQRGTHTGGWRSLRRGLRREPSDHLGAVA